MRLSSISKKIEVIFHLQKNWGGLPFTKKNRGRLPSTRKIEVIFYLEKLRSSSICTKIDLTDLTDLTSLTDLTDLTDWPDWPNCPDWPDWPDWLTFYRSQKSIYFDLFSRSKSIYFDFFFKNLHALLLWNIQLKWTLHQWSYKIL